MITVYLVCKMQENGTIEIIHKFYEHEAAKRFVDYGQFIMTVEEK